MDYINKVISTIYAIVDGENKAVAEVIENPGLGFQWLIRIDPLCKSNLDIFNKCMEIIFGLNDMVITYDIINTSYERGYLKTDEGKFESIALICDKIVV